MLRIGVVGHGLRVGGFLRSTMNTLEPDFRIVGVVDPDEKRARGLMRDCDKADAKFYPTIDEMIRQAKPDGIFVGTRCNLHTPIAVELAKYDIPIFLEKPVAVSMEQALALQDAFAKSKAPVVVSFPLRVTPLCARAIEMVRNGAVGEVMHITGLNYVSYGTVYYEFGYRNYEVTQGLFLQKATHDFDYIMELANSPIKRISANWIRGRIFGGDKPEDLMCSQCPEAHQCPESPQNRIRNNSGGVLEDHLCVFSKACGNLKDGINEEASNAIFEFESGAIGSYVQLVFVRREGCRGAIVTGPKGKLSFDWKNDDGIHYVEHHRPYQTTVTLGTGGTIAHSGGDIELARNFIDVIRYGAKSCSPIQAGLRSVFTCLAAREAAQTHRWVDVRQVEC